MTGKITLGAAALLGSLLLPSPAEAVATFVGRPQAVNIYSDSWHDGLVYYFTTGSVSSGFPGFGDSQISYASTQSEWIGVYLYDYSAGRFTEAAYSRYDKL